MNIPQTFELFSQVWQIRAGSPKELDNNNGLCYSDSCEILLNPNQAIQEMKQTLLHELVHAIETKLNLDLTENQVDTLALGLNHMFTTNPELASLFLAEDEELQDD